MKNEMSDGKGNRLVNGNKLAGGGRPPKGQGPETPAERRERLRAISGRQKPKPESKAVKQMKALKVKAYGPAYRLGDDGKWEMVSPGYKVEDER